MSEEKPVADLGQLMEQLRLFRGMLKEFSGQFMPSTVARQVTRLSEELDIANAVVSVAIAKKGGEVE